MSDCLDALGRHVRQARADVLFDGFLLAVTTGFLVAGVWTGWFDPWITTCLIAAGMYGAWSLPRSARRTRSASMSPPRLPAATAEATSRTRESEAAMPDHPCGFTLGQLLALWAMTQASTASGAPALRDQIQAHIRAHHAHDTQEAPDHE